MAQGLQGASYRTVAYSLARDFHWHSFFTSLTSVVDQDTITLSIYRKLIQSIEPDVVIGWFDHDTSLYKAGLSLGVPTIASVHIYWPICPALSLYVDGWGPCMRAFTSGCFKHVFRRQRRSKIPGIARLLAQCFKARMTDRLRIINRMPAVIVPSRRAKEILTMAGVRAPIYVVYNGINVGPLDRGGKREQAVALYASAAHTESKGFHHFAKVAEILARPKYKFIAVGEPRRRAQHIRFTGYISQVEVRKWFARSRVVVVPSLWEEPSSMVVLEAMAAGKPVVAYAVGGIPELVEDGVTGFLVDRGNVEVLAECVEYLLEDERAAQQMGEAARERCEEAFNLENMVHGYIEVIEEMQ